MPSGPPQQSIIDVHPLSIVNFALWTLTFGLCTVNPSRDSKAPSRKPDKRCMCRDHRRTEDVATSVNVARKAWLENCRPGLRRPLRFFSKGTGCSGMSYATIAATQIFQQWPGHASLICCWVCGGAAWRPQHLPTWCTKRGAIWPFKKGLIRPQRAL